MAYIRLPTPVKQLRFLEHYLNDEHTFWSKGFQVLFTSAHSPFQPKYLSHSGRWQSLRAYQQPMQLDQCRPVEQDGLREGQYIQYIIQSRLLHTTEQLLDSG